MSKFKVDDVVVCVNGEGWPYLQEDGIYLIVDNDEGLTKEGQEGRICIEFVEDWPEDFELLAYTSVAEGSKEEVDEVLGIERDMGKHYRYSFRLNLKEKDVKNGYVTVNIDPYRISEVYRLGGWREHIFKKVIRGLDKGHTLDELIAELQCTLDRAKQMMEESRE